MSRYPKIDLVDLAEKLMKWCELPDSLSLMGFCADMCISQEFLHGIASKDEKFVESLQTAKAKLGKKRELMAAQAKMPIQMYTRTATQYDKDLHKHERGDLKFELKAKSAHTAPTAPRDEILAAQHEALMLRHELAALKEQLKAQQELDTE